MLERGPLREWRIYGLALWTALKYNYKKSILSNLRNPFGMFVLDYI